MKLISLSRVALVALSIGLLVSQPVDAQRQRRSSSTQSAQKAEPLYPEATREESGLKATARFVKPLNKIAELLEKERYDDAIAEAQRVAGEGKANAYERAVAYRYIASAYIDKDDYPQAMAHLERALGENGLPNDAHYQLMFQLAQLQMAEEQYDTALATLDQFMAETRSEKPEYLATRGNALYRLERYEEAVESIQKAIATSDSPQSSWSQLLMASYFEMDKPQEAAKIAEELARANPDDKATLMNLSAIYLEADMFDKAAAVLADAKARGMLTEERDYQQLYRIYLNTEGKEAEAIAVIKEGLEKGILKPGHEVYNLMGQAYYFSDKIPEAIAAYREAAKYAENGETALNLARVLYNEEQYAEAKASANEAIQKGLRRPGDAWVILGNIEYYGVGNKAAGIAAFEQAAKYPETKDQAQKWLQQARRR